MRYRERESEQQEINISPLIDMVFILLIFFMVTATFVKDVDLEINRPKASSATPSSSKAVRVYIERGGDIYMGEEPIRLWALQSRLRDRLAAGGNATVLVISDESVAAQRLIEVVDQCRLAGAEDVGVVTEQEAG
jgi:biopolymer transport protein ExbD